MSEYTVKEFAARERVEERTVRRWITKGAVDTRRTPGGGIRISERRDGTVADTTKRDNSGHSSA